ncbi:hypothetical protein P3675_23315 [Vibrio parahaemolyticus]|uniref:hypothetical protein n=1 Tax=Vibrio parahaemolyticus TaxID=670 RepID=UPI001F1BC1F4|nr:hypothetical protein [Vibrio parahaemolyticus]MDF4559697.1 hypothetical protein [Vibrio parahaemolyticus]MDF4564851.1 hypothetical protein [Vibrio parahaemolyticus]MDF5382305.1 hypothetical protein [Vibrio parahaemolyticus]MDG2937899.1 hypothetical protein [Vibrio parahaemolyticus]UJW95369.1 hypothetical protein JHS95_06275 [Vibrio parahaemolyticus]
MHLTDDDKEFIKAFRKSILTFIGGGVLGFIALALMKYLTVNHTGIQLCILIVIELLILVKFFRYRKLSESDKAKENNYNIYIKRELLKAFFNSFLMFYTFYSIFFAFYGISNFQDAWGIISNSYSDYVVLLNLIFVPLSYVSNNTILNFITAKSEKIDAKLKAAKLKAEKEAKLRAEKEAKLRAEKEEKVKKMRLEKKQKIINSIPVENS